MCPAIATKFLFDLEICLTPHKEVKTQNEIDSGWWLTPSPYGLVCDRN